jgi:hypothetical protein
MVRLRFLLCCFVMLLAITVSRAQDAGTSRVESPNGQLGDAYDGAACITR